MPAKPLTSEQKQDSERFSSAFRLWKSNRKEEGLRGTQEVAAAILGISQAAFSDYCRGVIPLNVSILTNAHEKLGFDPNTISPTLSAEMSKIALASGISDQKQKESSSDLKLKSKLVDWPFSSLTYDEYVAMKDSDKQDVEALLKSKIERYRVLPRKSVA